MSKKRIIIPGLLALFCFITEQIFARYYPDSPWLAYDDYLQLTFFALFALTCIIAIWSYAQAPEIHFAGMTLCVLVLASLAFVASIPLYHVPMRTLDFVVKTFGPMLP